MDIPELKIDEKKISVIVENFGTKCSFELFQSIEQQLILFKKLAQEIEEIMSSEEAMPGKRIQVYRSFNQQVGKFNSQIYNSSDTLALRLKFREYVKLLELFIAELPKSMTRMQDDARFVSEPGDNYRIRFYKNLKSMVRSFQVAGRPVINIFRKIAGKPGIGMPEWKHTVAVRQLFRYSYRNVLLENLFPLFEETLEALNVMHYRLIALDDQFSKWFFQPHEELSPEVTSAEIHKNILHAIHEIAIQAEETKTHLASKIKEAGTDALKRYKDLERISGTIEYPDAKSSVGIINRNYSRLLSDLDAIEHRYGNSTLLLFDDWRFDTSVNGLSAILLKEKTDILQTIDEKYNADLEKFINKYSALLKDAEKHIREKGSSPGVLKKILKDFKSGFASLLIQSLSNLRSRSIPGRISSISRSFSLEIADLPETRIYIKKFDASKTYKDSELQQIRSADILRYEIMPELETELSDLASESGKRLETLFNLMSEIGTIAEFSIESAIKQIIERHEGLKDPEATLIEGLERSGEKTLALREIYSDLKNQLEEDLNEILDAQIESIQELRENEKVLALNMRLAKVSLKRRARERWISIRKITRNIFEIVYMSPVRLIISLLQRIRRIFTRVVYSATPQTISAELSAYLAESKNALSKLPYIYQRLYLVEPLKDNLFYYHRESEHNQLDVAITYWENENYSPTAIICEKGSGSTSFINQYRSGLSAYKTSQIGSVLQMHSREEFISFLSKNLGLTAKDLPGIVEQLNKAERQIIFLEDIQNLYLRTVDGFSALKTLFSIMSLTYEKVLWITSCTKYAWEYLELTLGISGYFNSHVRLSQLNADSIREVILKRHAVSGYSITFHPNKIQEKTRQYRKIPQDQQQAYLEERYFMNMNRFAMGNISLALHFWVRSTKEVQDKQIIMSSIYDGDYSFLSTLDSNLMVILTMICIHDGVNAKNLSRILRKPEEESDRELNQLYADSIVVRREDYYLINPALYRHVVEFLKNKNFIQ